MKDLFLKKIKLFSEKQKIDAKYFSILKEFYLSYKKTAKIKKEQVIKIFTTFLNLLEIQFKTPFKFQAYHKKIRTPFDYYKFGLEFLRPLIEIKNSKLLGKENLKKIEKQLRQKENVILFGNHQSECDPQAISTLLEKDFPNIASKIIYVAGERVLTDILAIPFSMGCDLLCIYSKKYIDAPPFKKREKQLHNKKTMKLMSHLLEEGGKIIYVAPSGGRDRPNEKKVVKIAKFDPRSIEMFYLMAKKAKTVTHFYPLALYTYDILPPPDQTQIEMGEKRITKGGKIHAFFEKEIDMNLKKELGATEDKAFFKKNRSKYIQKIVENSYNILKDL